MHGPEGDDGGDERGAQEEGARRPVQAADESARTPPARQQPKLAANATAPDAIEDPQQHPRPG